MRLRALGAEVRVCAPPDEEFAELPAAAGVPLVPVGQSARALMTAASPPSPLPWRAAELIASQFAAVTAAAEGRDALVATGAPQAAAGPRRSDSDLRVPVGRAPDGPDPRDPRTSDRRGRHDPHRRDNGGREAAARRG
ncbi:hypothetical protein [Streptomyces sp. NPDC048496]|uniref:hypothetical protein n=1 Tax=Streptomyces sp. NPDC048496 TaxID=3365558 RepID=UPI003710F476